MQQFKTIEEMEAKWQQKKPDDKSTIPPEDLDTIRRDLKSLRDKINSLNMDFPTITSLSSRLESLELWKGKVHNLLIAETPTGKEKLTPMAKMLKKGYK